MVGEHLVDEAHRLRLVRRHPAPGVGQLAADALGNQLGEPLQRAHVGGHADVDLLDAEEGVLGGVAHVAGGDHVDGATDAAALDGGEDRHAGLLEAAEGLLEVEQVGAQVGPDPAELSRGPAPTSG